MGEISRAQKEVRTLFSNFLIKGCFYHILALSQIRVVRDLSNGPRITSNDPRRTESHIVVDCRYKPVCNHEADSEFAISRFDVLRDCSVAEIPRA